MSGEPRLPEQRRPAAESGSAGPALRFGVLGPVRAWRGRDALDTGSPQQRALLAALLLRGGRTATAGELIDSLWEGEPPQQALATVRTYASRLRKILGPGVLVSESGGYAIRVRADALDLTRAEELWAEARKCRSAGRLTRVRELIDEALRLWDGEPLAGVPGPYAQAQRTRLVEWRLQLLETRLEADLEQGRHAEAVSELTALTAAHPLRERLRELLMLALYRSGRQAEALAVFADTRRLLADELGVDPRAALRQLQERILRADPDLSRPAAPVAEPVVAPVRPAQLPATVPDFTGRDLFVNELSQVLSSDGGRVMAVSAVAGIGGVGKTTLAVHVAHAVRSAFPDGQLYMDLQGTSQRPVEPEVAVQAFLRALGTAESAIPDTLDERAALYRSVLDGRRVLVLLDNAHDAAQVRPLLPGTEGCAALITSRVRMVDLVGAHLVDLDVMSPAEALQLFTRIVGAERVASERESALDVVAACGFLPLAIRIAAARLAARPTWTVSLLARRLADERRRLDELQAGDLAVEATFELGYGQLEPAQARAFRLLGLADGPDISLAAAAALLDLPAADTERLLEVLVDISLLESAAPDRYRFHDLVRLYARACAERDEQPAERAAALSRLLDFYLATAARVYAAERPGDRLVDHLERTEYPGLRFPDRDTALDWLFTESDCLLACVQQCATGPMLRRATDLLMAAVDLAESGANSRRYEAVARFLTEAAHDEGDLLAEGRARTFLAHAYSMTGRFEEAEDQALLALKCGTAAGDALVMARVPNQRGIIALYEHRYDDARAHLRQAVEAFQRDHNHSGEAVALYNLSRVHLALDDTSTAVDLAQRGVGLLARLGSNIRLANAKYSVGIALTQAGRYEEALVQLTDALEAFRHNRQRLWEGMAHSRIAEAYLAANRPARAAEHAEEALALRGLGGEWRRGMMLTILGKALRGIAQSVRAEACWREALSIYGAYDKLGSPEAAEVRDLLSGVTTG